MKTIVSIFCFLGIFSSLFEGVAQNNYAYNEEFNEGANWLEASNEVRSLYISYGFYYFEHKKDEGFRDITTKSFTIDTSKDFIISTSIKKISGVQNRGISFLYNYTSSEEYSEFAYSANGYFRVSESNETSNFKLIKPWTKSSHINVGNNGVNRLSIIKKGRKLFFMINGKKVYETVFKPFKGRKLALRLYRNQKVAIDYFRVNYIGNSSTSNSLSNPTSSNTILFEGFNSNTRGWLENEDSYAKLSVENGEYYISHKRETGGWSSTITKYINSSRDFRISAQIKKVSGIQNNGYGITFGKKNNDNQNHFLVSGNGAFKIVKYENGKRTYLKNWTESSYIKKGNYATNYLTIEKKGNTYLFYVNGSLVHTSYTVKLYGNNIGFTVFNNQAIKVGYLSLIYTDKKANAINTIFNTKTSDSKHVAKQTILFDGYSDNKNDWSIQNNENVSFKIVDGKYLLDHKRTKGGWSTTIPKYIDTSRDFKIVADIKKESGILNNGYGIIFGRKDSNNQNLFYVNGKGSFSVNKIKNGKDNFLKSWTSNQAIKKGNGVYNILKVVKQGNKLEYYVNDKKVFTDYYPEFFGNRLGYILYDRQKISISYLSIGYLDNKYSSTKTSNSSSLYNTSSSTIDKTISYSYDNEGYHFSDQFNNNSKSWYLVNNDKINFRIKNGKYYLKHKRNVKGWSSYDYNYIDTNKDFEIQTKIDKISGVLDYGYGLLFGKHESNDFRFCISSSGAFKISKRINNIEKPIKDWTKSAYINTGNQKSNILTVKKIKGYYKFYINGAFVYQMDFQSFFGNDLGFIVYNDQEIAVDYIRVKYAGSFVND